MSATTNAGSDTTLAGDVVATARRLIRFDTTNPPGDVAGCTAWIAELLTDSGVPNRILAGDPLRPNLVARLPGRGVAPPLVLHAHTDVVPTDGQPWSRDPFRAEIVPDAVAGDEIWGRGAIDMKGSLAMMLAAVQALRRDGVQPAGDVILAVVSDEEVGSANGAHWLLHEHPELFAGARYAVGEDGGADLDFGGTRRLHPIVVAEKRACWLRVTLRGPGGHASRVAGPDSAIRQLTRLLTAIEPGGLPPAGNAVVDRLLAELGPIVPQRFAGPLERLRADQGDAHALAALPPRDAQYLRSVTRHSVNATVLHGGTTTNVLPAEIVVELDGRLLPGPYSPEHFIAALSELAGPLDAEVLVLGEQMPEPVLDGFYDQLAGVLRDRDPDGVPVPMMTTASTDARLFAQLGLRCYGWTPLLLPPGATHRSRMHAADERVPVQALRFGAACFEDLLRGYR